MLRSAYENNEQDYFTEFSTQKSESLYGIFQYIKNE
jgi:hypothetical protein